jgi:putative ABC transport system substrate-binding protein
LFKKLISRILLAWLTAWPVFASGAAATETPLTAVLYPEVSDPFRSIFLNIVSGIEEGIKGPVNHYLLKKNEDPSELTGKLEQDRVRVVIALGRAGLLTAQKLPETLPAIVGAVALSPNAKTQKLSGISLTPDPEILFRKLKTLAPGVKRVTVIYNPDQYEWGIVQAREAAKLLGLTLNALPATDLHSSASLYRNTLSGIKNDSEAIWLPQDDTTMDENALLPFILKEAWDKNLVVFSSNPDHVRKGALFSMYPDNIGMGRSLAALALNQIKNKGTHSPGIVPLRDLLTAVNLRTAEHLGFKFAGQEKREFNLVFPSP